MHVFIALLVSATFLNPIPEPGPSIAPTLLGVLIADPPTLQERSEVEVQISRCRRKVRRTADPFRVLALLRYERVLGVPESHRGFLGAVWCWENAMRTEPKVGDEGRSHGAFQMQAWFWDWCRLPMTKEVTSDLFIAAACYWSRVEHYLADGRCPGNVVRAEAMAANGPRYAPFGCAAVSKHALELARWRE